MTGINGKVLKNPNSKTVILFDSSYSLDTLKEIIENNGSVIISFGYSSHKILSDHGIKHMIADEFLSITDLWDIWKKSFSLSQWYNNSEIAEILEYKGINTGKLFYIEFHYHLLPFLKKFMAIIFLCKKFHSSRILAPSSLSDIFDLLDHDVEYIKVKQKSESFLYDSVKFQITDSLSIKIPKKSYLKLKNISEQTILKLLRNNRNNKNQRKHTLLIEFNPIKYQRLFELSTKHGIQLILFNRRRPYVWNKESYSIIKNSNCLIGAYQNTKNKKIEKLIESGKELLANKTNSLFEREEIFNTFFSINGHSFWKAIKPSFVKLCKKRVLDAVQEIELADEVIKNSDVSSIIVSSENGFNEQVVLHLAKKHNIKTLLLQHGMYWETMENKEGNIFLGGDFPILSSKILTWGTQTEKYAKECGFSKKTHVIGSPSHDILFNDRSDTNLVNDGFILLATSSPQQNQVFDLSIDNLEAYEKTIKDVCKIAQNLSKQLIIKIHPFQEERDIKKIVEDMGDHVTVTKNDNIVDLIKSCDTFLVNDLSTTMLDALIIGKPVISIQTKNRYMKELPKIFTAGCCVKCNISSLEKEIKEILTTDKRTRMIKNGNKFVKEFISNQGSSSKKLLEFLAEY
tara:strand:+ start:1638 stop:3521 length:1884 start_codon:yes stop_codon:yes gene_type:complete